MKKIFLLFITSILAINLAFAQNDWVSYKIDSKLSVKLPGQPIKLNENSVYIRDKDTTVYIIAYFDVQKTVGLDSTQLESQAPTSEFANHFKNGMLEKMPGSTLGDVKIGTWNRYTSYIIEGSNASNKLKLNAFVVVIGANIYSLMVVLPESHSLRGKDYLFNSLVLN